MLRYNTENLNQETECVQQYLWYQSVSKAMLTKDFYIRAKHDRGQYRVIPKDKGILETCPKEQGKAQQGGDDFPEFLRTRVLAFVDNRRKIGRIEQQSDR